MDCVRLPEKQIVFFYRFHCGGKTLTLSECMNCMRVHVFVCSDGVIMW